MTLLCSAALIAARGPITDGLFGGRAALTAALIAGVAGYALSYFVARRRGGVRWFGGYGLLLLADGGDPRHRRAPAVVLASPTVAAVAIAAAAAGGALAPLFSRRRDVLRRATAGGQAAESFASAPPRASRCRRR